MAAHVVITQQSLVNPVTGNGVDLLIRERGQALCRTFRTLSRLDGQLFLFDGELLEDGCQLGHEQALAFTDIGGAQRPYDFLLARVSLQELLGDADTAVEVAGFAARVEMVCDLFHGPVPQSCVTGYVTTAVYIPL